jgi:hypothetical protein
MFTAESRAGDREKGGCKLNGNSKREDESLSCDVPAARRDSARARIREKLFAVRDYLRPRVFLNNV